MRYPVAISRPHQGQFAIREARLWQSSQIHHDFDEIVAVVGVFKFGSNFIRQHGQQYIEIVRNI